MDLDKVKSQQKSLINQIHEHCPKLGKFFDLEMTLEEYSSSINDFEKNEIFIKRQTELKEMISEKIKKVFGANAIEKKKVYYQEQMAINIVDHHQVLNHPILISDNIIADTSKYLQSEKQNAQVVFSSGDVPPNNYFSKNGFMLNNKKVPLFSNSEKEFCTYYIPKRSFDFIERLKSQKRLAEFDKQEYAFLEELSDKLIQMDFSKCVDYKDQITTIVNQTWPLMFESKLRDNLPEIIYITQEEITSKALLQLISKDNLISQALFDKDFRNIILESFRGIVVTWDESNKKGTHFFWRKHPKEPRSIRLYLEGDKLSPSNEKYKDLSFKLNKKNVVELLQKEEIYPSLFLIFTVLNFYYGVKPLVGHGSIEYLNRIKKVWLDLILKSDFKDEWKNIETVNIDKKLTGITLFIKQVAGEYQQMYAHDVMYSGGILGSDLEKFFSMKYNELLSTSVNGIYDYVAQKYISEDKKIKPQYGFSDYFQLLKN